MRETTRWLYFIAIIMALIVPFGAFPDALAADGRDFSGFYDLSNVTDLGETLAVTLTLEIFNHLNADVYDVMLTVLPSTEPEAGLTSMELPYIGSRESTRLSGEFILAKEEHSRWQQGISPMVRIEFNRAAGGRERKFVEIARMPLSEEE